MGKHLPESDYNSKVYNSWFIQQGSDSDQFQEGRYLGTSEEIENLRPRSPVKGMPTLIQEYENIYNQMLENQQYIAQ